MYHVSPGAHRGSILYLGLDFMHGQGYTNSGPTPGNYLFGTRESAIARALDDFGPGADVFTVDVTDLTVGDDPRVPDGFLIRCPVGPERVRLLGYVRSRRAGA